MCIVENNPYQKLLEPLDERKQQEGTSTRSYAWRAIKTF